MPGPPPNPNSIRRNKHHEGHLNPEGAVDSRLKKLRDRSTYSAFTQLWWDVWVASPQAEHFEETDFLVLQRLAMLVEAFVKRPGHNAAAEIRQTETLLGATVMDRLRLRMGKKKEEVDPEREDLGDAADFMAAWEKRNA